MELNNISKRYGDKIVFDNFSYKFDTGKITVILGDSGVGKTTLVNIMLGLTDYSGEVKNNSKISCVFQNDRLIPNLSVKDNLLLINKDINIDEELSKMDLLEAKDYFPSNLSAGMSRRVSILRALNYNAEVLLMDEPLRNLDYYLKYKIMNQIKDYHKKTKNTIIIVTHDLKEAVYLADKIIVIKDSNNFKKINKITDKTEDELLEILLKKEK